MEKRRLTQADCTRANSVSASKSRRLRNKVLAGCLAVLAIGSAPQRAAAQSESPAGVQLFLALDNSGSMRVNDPDSLMKGFIAGLVSKLSAEDAVGLVVYDSTATLVSPLRPLKTPEDRERLLAGIEGMKYDGKLTNIPAAVERSWYELRDSSAGNRGRFVLLVTDGMIDTGDAQKDKEQARWLKENILPECRKDGVRILSVAFSEAADYALLQSMARETGGSYYRVFAKEGFQDVFAKLLGVISPPAPVPVAAQTAGVRNQAAQGQPGREAPEQAERRLPAQSPSLLARLQHPDMRPYLLGAGGLFLVALLTILYVLFRPGKAAIRPEGAPAMPEASLLDVQTGDIVPLTKPELTIGRIPLKNDIVISKGTVSNQHARILFREGVFSIKDLASRNGTYVNGKRIQEDTTLRNGDVFSIESHEYRFLGSGDAGRTVISGAMEREEAKTQDPPATVADSLAQGEASQSAGSLFDMQTNSLVELDKPVTRLGRLPQRNDIVINLQNVSSEHAKIELRKGYYYLEDLSSSNGTFINDKRITSETVLRNGVIISLAGYQYRFLGGAEAGGTILTPG